MDHVHRWMIRLGSRDALEHAVLYNAGAFVVAPCLAETIGGEVVKENDAAVITGERDGRDE